jgi:hypothetical protein
MELVTKVSWALLALIHASPAAVLFAPKLLRDLYGIEADGALGVLLVHRGALFLAIIAACVFALFDASSRRAASVVVTISVVGFLVVYARAGLPPGALRTIAIVDVVALLPLGWVLLAAWRLQAA